MGAECKAFIKSRKSEEAAEVLEAAGGKETGGGSGDENQLPMAVETEYILIADQLNYAYENVSAANVQFALKNLSFSVKRGEFIGLIGRSGSGKSTLALHLNGLLCATYGHLYFHGADIYEKGYDKKKLRRGVGLLFQYPEHQLFESTVFQDVCFGPKNFGMKKKEAELCAFEALQKVKFPAELFYRSPFSLSGGQKRRAALAGMLASRPEIVVLDEPTAGLDPAGRREILTLLKEIQQEERLTVILISHNMDEIAQYAERVLVLQDGEIAADGAAEQVFSQSEMLQQAGLKPPAVLSLLYRLQNAGIPIGDAVTPDETQRKIEALYRSKNTGREFL